MNRLLQSDTLARLALAEHIAARALRVLAEIERLRARGAGK